MTNLSKLRAGLLGSGVILTLAASPAFAGKTDDLRAQIDALQARLDQLEKQQATTETKPAMAPADAIMGGDYPGSFKLPGSDTSYSIHGFTKLDLIFDTDSVPLATSNFFISGLPANNVPAGNQGFRTNLFAQQSRLIFGSRTPTNYGLLITHMETDFEGTLGGTDSVLPNNQGGTRIRNVWGQLGPVRAGFDNEIIQDLGAGIEHITFLGPSGPSLFKRTAQINYTQPYGAFLFKAGIEMPGSASGNVTGVANGTPLLFLTNTSAALAPGAGNGIASNQQLEMPNISGGVRYGAAWGHVWAGGRLRKFDLDNGHGGDAGGTNAHLDELTYLGNLASRINLGYFLPALGKDYIAFNGNWGSGDSGSQSGIDDAESITVINFGLPGQKSFTNPVYGISAGGQHWWTANLRSNFNYAYSKIHLSHEIAPLTGAPGASNHTTDTQMFLVNLIWSPVKQVNFGLEYIYGERHGLSAATGATDGYTAHGTNNRIQVGMQYLF